MDDRDQEPCTIDATVVSAYLEDMGMPRMAAYVRRQGWYMQQASDSEKKAFAALEEATARLHQYEPPLPPPRTDYRSKWD